MDPTGLLLDAITESLPEERNSLRQLKKRIAETTRTPLLRNDRLLRRYREDVAQGTRLADERVERILRLNAIRSESGIATVTVITKPYACPGRCVYCPTEARAPKSYLTNEPAVMRALRSDYDPFDQVRHRLAALYETGHPTDKIELIVKGGTWSFYPQDYQQWFVQRCFDAANGFGESAPSSSESLAAAHETNEHARSRLVGLTIETRPDYINPVEIDRLLKLGVTRVELGVQSLEEEVLALTVRDHGLEAVRDATRLLKDAGFKIAYHLMPNLPLATPQSDIESARRIFSEPDFQPDTIKLYPCVVVESAELYDWWRDGRYKPYDDATLVDLLASIKELVPPYVRIERVIRDIPSTSIAGGCLLTNLRESVFVRMKERGVRCRCIRCRQVRGPVDDGFAAVRRTYAASGGTEEFLSFEDPEQTRLASLLRLRIPAAGKTALVRELHSYGEHLPLQTKRASAVQHRGYGRQLLEQAEVIARDEHGMDKIAVISGVGAREYYRKFGYALEGPYMVKTLL